MVIGFQFKTTSDRLDSAISNIQPLQINRPVMLDYIRAVYEPFDVAIISGGAIGR
jgi:hypothetical protein